MEDCWECGTPETTLYECQFGNCYEHTKHVHNFCAYCWERIARECPKCNRRGCKSHFDGMYCIDCVLAQKEDTLQEASLMTEPTDICLICGDEKPIEDLHRNCGK